MDKIRSVTRPYGVRWPRLPRSARRWLSAVAAAMCVVLVATGAVMALTYAGPVTVTANMTPFSPNPVKVDDAATSSFSANCTPPSGVSEGDLSPQYDWSVSVEYKPLQADSFGSPPSGSYTDSLSLPIHRDKLCCRLNATLTFTPKVAGYWQASASCGVTVTDTTTGFIYNVDVDADLFAGGPVLGGTEGIQFNMATLFNVKYGGEFPLQSEYGWSNSQAVDLDAYTIYGVLSDPFDVLGGSGQWNGPQSIGFVYQWE